MNKIVLFMAVIMTSLAVTFAPVKKAEAFCEIECLLTIGGQQVQELKSRLEAALASLQQSAMSVLEDAKSWIEKYFSSAWSSKTSNMVNSSVTMAEMKAPNLVGAGSGITGDSYTLRRNSSGKLVTAKVSGGTAEERAAQQQASLMTYSGTMSGMRYENSVKAYQRQRDAIDSLAKALVIKKNYEDLDKLSDELDNLKRSIVPNTTPSAQPVQGAQAEAEEKATLTGSGQKDRSVETALRDNLQVRLLWDSLLTTQQQVLAMRLKAASMQSYSELDAIGTLVDEIKEVKAEGTPSHTEDPEAETNTKIDKK